MERIRLYIKESYDELVNKVTWPPVKSLQSNSILVIVTSLIFALLVFVMDLVSNNSLKFIYGLFN